MHNLYEQFRQLIPDPPLQAGTVVGVGSGVVTVALPGGGLAVGTWADRVDLFDEASLRSSRQAHALP